jgi:NAD(P)-dependent dehydrogenase (short-subunit alcohol dehydrogenase family)
MAHALIWGVDGGIGAALAGELMAGGWQVAGIARREPAQAAVEARYQAANFADQYEVDSAILAAAQDHPQLDLMVYAAGDITSQKVADMTPTIWQQMLDANLTGPFLTTRQTLPLLAPDATLLYIGAVQERLRLPGLSAYAAAKAGLEAFVEAFAKEERKRKILLVRPGAVDTPFWAKVALRLPKNALAPATLAQQIVAAINDGKTGVIDL